MTLHGNPTSPVALAEPPLDADDPRAVFAQAVALATAVIGRVVPEQLSNPTPCAEFDVRDLLGHLVVVLRRVAAIGRGDDAFGAGVLATVHGDRWQEAWVAAAHDVEVAWADDVALTRTVRLPWAEDTGAKTLVSYLNEVTVHTWDLATATGQRPAWDPKVLGLAFDGIRFMPGEGRWAIFEAVRAEMPPAQRNFADPFADAVPVPEDAPLIDRLIAWNGRSPC
ncbi:MAG TPA: TIGR03086 family metal-binding protein [Acidimicrobiales bacterium]|nr:TIGR03086 family metal-binding protein [Acidimicrobiales bacterium]